MNRRTKSYIMSLAITQTNVWNELLRAIEIAEVNGEDEVAGELRKVLAPVEAAANALTRIKKELIK